MLNASSMLCLSIQLHNVQDLFRAMVFPLIVILRVTTQVSNARADSLFASPSWSSLLMLRNREPEQRLVGSMFAMFPMASFGELCTNAGVSSKGRCGAVLI